MPISHNLRTPLTSLHGYLETLLMKADVLHAGEPARRKIHRSRDYPWRRWRAVQPLLERKIDNRSG